MNWCSPSAAAAFTPWDINIHFLGFNEAGNRQGGCPRRSGFNINGDSVKQPNTGGGSWLPPNPGLHINEIMLQFSQLQPLPDRCLYSRTTFHHRLDPPKPSHHSFTCIHTRRTLSLRLFNQIHTTYPPPPPPHIPPPPTNSAKRLMLKLHVICLTHQLSIHIWIVPVSPWRQWGMEWNPFQGKHYCPRGNTGAEVRAGADIPTCTSADTHISSALPDLRSAVLPLFEIQHRQRIQHCSSGSWGSDWNHKFLAVSNHPELSIMSNENLSSRGA